MKLPVVVTFHGLPSSEWIETDIRKRAAKLDVFHPGIISCHVSVHIPHRRHHKGNQFSVHIDLIVPRAEIAVTHRSNLHSPPRKASAQEWAKPFDVDGARKDIRLVVREAFDVAKRRLQDRARKRYDPRRLVRATG